MKKKYSEEQIVKALRQVDGGMSRREVCRQIGISEPTFYAWRKKYQGMQLSEIKRLKTLEAENMKLKRIVADQALDIIMLKDVNSRKW